MARGDTVAKKADTIAPLWYSQEMEMTQPQMPQGLMSSSGGSLMGGSCRHPIENIALNMAVGMTCCDVTIALTHYIHEQSLTESDMGGLERIQETVAYIRHLQKEPYSVAGGHSDEATRHTSLLLLEGMRLCASDEEQVLRCLEDAASADEESLRKTRDVFIRMGEESLARSRPDGCF